MFRYVSKLGSLFAVLVAMAVAALIAVPAQAANGPLSPTGAAILQDSSNTPYPANVDYPVALVNKPGGVSATFLGTTYPCAGATASGDFNSSDPFTNPYMTLDVANITGCAGPLGTTINVSLNAGCLMVFRADPTTQNVDDLLIDSVTGTMSLETIGGLPCTLNANGGFLCNMQVAGSVAATFVEDKGTGVQQINVGGPGLTIASATGLCAGTVTGAAIDFNLGMDVTAGSNPGDKINFIP